MNATIQFALLGALTDAGVLFHDVLGVIGLLVLLGIGIFLHKRQNQQLSRQPRDTRNNSADRAFGWVQAWAVYWVIVAAAAGFFFVMPRATSQRQQSEPGQPSGGSTNP